MLQLSYVNTPLSMQRISFEMHVSKDPSENFVKLEWTVGRAVHNITTYIYMFCWETSCQFGNFFSILGTQNLLNFFFNEQNMQCLQDMT